MLTPSATGANAGRTVAGYYLKNSWGQFHVTKGGIADWVTLGKGPRISISWALSVFFPRLTLRGGSRFPVLWFRRMTT